MRIVVLLIAELGLLSCTTGVRPQTTRDGIPHSVGRAVDILKEQWLPGSALDWILRNPKDVVTARLHLPFGTSVRNEFRLWGRNPSLMKSCGVTDPEACSGIIFERLWESVRREADSELVRRLDCQFELINLIRIRYAGFYRLRIGEILERTQEQIDQQVISAGSALPAGCAEPASLLLKPTGDPDLSCWSRAEFSENRNDPVSLSQFLGWISWRNGFDVLHAPPEITLPFREKCSWPQLPKGFQPGDI